MLYLYILTWIVNVILLMLKKKNTPVVFLSVCFLVLMYFWSTGSGDYQNNYEAYVYHAEFNQLEIGYKASIIVFNSFGISFQSFQGIVCSICLLVALSVYRKFSNNYHLFFSVYLIYQCFYDMDTMKNFIARTLLFIAIYWLIRNRKDRFALIVLIASLFHRSMMVYLLLVFVDFKSINYRRVKIFLSAIFISTIVAYIVAQVPNVFEALIRVRAFESISAKIQTYFSSASRVTFILYYFLHCMNVCFLISNKTAFAKYIRLYNAIFILDVFVIVSFPLIIINNVFFRLFNNIYLFNYIAYAVVLKEASKNNYSKKVIEIMLINACYRLPIVHSAAEYRRVLM